MIKKYTKDDLFKMDAVDVYKLVLEGKHIKRFPIGFWQQPDSISNAIKCTKFLLFSILNLDEGNEEAVLNNVNVELFAKYKLNGMLRACFKGSPYEVVNNIYPDKYKPWELPNAPKHIWHETNIVKATKWLIEEKLKLSDEELKEQLSIKLFEDNGLLGMIQTISNSSPFKVIELTYPGKFQPWEFNIVSNNYWNKKTGIKATKWLIEEKLKLSDEEIKELLCNDLFYKNGLHGMLSICFNDSSYDAINNAYPNKFNPWEFNVVSKNYWTKENGIKATKWLIEEKLKLKTDEDFKILSKTIFYENGLSGMYQQCFNDDLYATLNETYPNRFKPWQFRQVPKGYWNDINNCIDATKWLIEDKLHLNNLQEVSYKTFKDNGLYWMLEMKFNGDYKKAIKTAYPNGMVIT